MTSINTTDVRKGYTFNIRWENTLLDQRGDVVHSLECPYPQALIRCKRDYTCNIREKKKLEMLMWWCDALPGVTMAVLYLAHIHTEHGCEHNQCVVCCRVSTTADVMLLFAAWCQHCSCIESSSSLK